MTMKKPKAIRRGSILTYKKNGKKYIVVHVSGSKVPKILMHPIRNDLIIYEEVNSVDVDVLMDSRYYTFVKNDAGMFARQKMN